MHNGVELLPNHGFPVRLMVPAWYGNANVKSDGLCSKSMQCISSLPQNQVVRALKTVIHLASHD